MTPTLKGALILVGFVVCETILAVLVGRWLRHRSALLSDHAGVADHTPSGG